MHALPANQQGPPPLSNCAPPSGYPPVESAAEWAGTFMSLHYLRRIVEAGFGKRVTFGSDQMVWPDAIEVSIESIETADFLNQDQKRDILYNNAARFLRLSQDQIARQYGR